MSPSGSSAASSRSASGRSRTGSSSCRRSRSTRCTPSASRRCRISSRAARTRHRSSLRTVRRAAIVATLVFPVFAATAPPLVPLVFGDRWSSSAEIIPFICLGTIVLGSIAVASTSYLSAVGRPGIVAWASGSLGVVWIAVDGGAPAGSGRRRDRHRQPGRSCRRGCDPRSGDTTRGRRHSEPAAAPRRSPFPSSRAGSAMRSARPVPMRCGRSGCRRGDARPRCGRPLVRVRPGFPQTVGLALSTVGHVQRPLRRRVRRAAETPQLPLRTSTQSWSPAAFAPGEDSGRAPVSRALSRRSAGTSPTKGRTTSRSHASSAARGRPSTSCARQVCHPECAVGRRAAAT